MGFLRPDKEQTTFGSIIDKDQKNFFTVEHWGTIKLNTSLLHRSLIKYYFKVSTETFNV